MIVVIDNVFTQQECDCLISLHTEYEDKVEKWYGTRPLDFKFIPKELGFSFVEKIQSAVNNVFKEVEYDWGQIVKWNTFIGQGFHIDTFSEKTTLASITYLNNNFSGGNTIFNDGTSIRPMVGRTLVFNGRQYYHGVEQVLEGVRWTVPIWYKNKVK